MGTSANSIVSVTKLMLSKKLFTATRKFFAADPVKLLQIYDLDILKE